MRTVIIDNYTFDAAAKTITFLDFTKIDLKRVISVTNITNGKQIYFYKSPSFNGSVVANVLTLNFNTGNPPFLNTDVLSIEYALDNEVYEVLPSTARTVSADTNMLTSYGQGIGFIINTTAVGGGSSTVIKVQVKNYLGVYVDVPNAVTAAITVTGSTTLLIHPDLTESANRKASFAMPKQYRLSYTISAGTVTFDVSAFKID